MKDDQLIDLIEGCKKGDIKSQNSLFNEFSKSVRVVIKKYYRDIHTINDIEQDAFIKIFKSINKYEFKGSFEGWLKKIVKNLIIDGIRNKKMDFTYDDKFDCYHTTTEDMLSYDYSADEKISDIIDESNKLSHSYGLVFKLYYIEGLSHKDISTELGINEGTSKSNLHKAKKNIYQKLKNKVY